MCCYGSRTHPGCVFLDAAPPQCDLTSLRVQGSVVQCGPGHGLAISQALGVIVTSNTRTQTLAVWDLQPDWSVSVRCAVGRPGRGKLEFAFGVAGGGLCFTVPPVGEAPSPAPALLVADAGNHRVQEVCLAPGPWGASPLGASRAGHHYPARGTEPCLAGVYLLPKACPGQPWSVAASRTMVAVGLGGEGPGQQAVALFHAASRAHLRTALVGANPGGLRLSADDQCVVYACPGVEGGVRRLSTPALVPVEGSASRPELEQARDVEEVVGGYLVPCNASGQVLFVPRDGGGVGPGGPVLGSAGSGPGQFLRPVALALAPGLALVVREAGNDGRFQIFA